MVALHSGEEQERAALLDGRARVTHSPHASEPAGLPPQAGGGHEQ